MRVPACVLNVAQAVVLLVSLLSVVESQSHDRSQETSDVNIHDVIRATQESASTKQSAVALVSFHHPCRDHTDCSSCAHSSHGCHWCNHDERCHAIGSVHGCPLGSSCDQNNDNHNSQKKKKQEPDSCAAHPSCLECGAHSTCHWCAHDDACHRIGSFYGCAIGVDCFAADKCRRKHPEPLPPATRAFTLMPVHDIVLLVLCALLLWGCASLGMYGVWWCHKGKHRTLSISSSHVIQLDEEPDNLETPLLGDVEESPDPQPGDSSTAVSDESSPENDNSGNQESNSSPSEQEALLEQGMRDATTNIDAAQYMSIENEHNQQDGDEPEILAQSEERGISSFLFRFAQWPRSSHRHQEQQQQQQQQHRPSSKFRQRIFHGCVGLYILICVLLGGTVFAALRLFPQIPEYSTCNDNLAWKKLIDSIVYLQVEADFELLISLKNENHFSVALDQGHGNFHFEDAVVGNYTIPRVEVQAMAITDILVLARLHPKQWQALSMAEAYYQGKLVLNVDAELDVRVPSLFNISRQVTAPNRDVNVNEQQDRHLCACQRWGSDNSSQNGKSLEVDN